MITYQYAFEAFEDCKMLRGAEFLNAWRQLMALDPAHAAGVLLATLESNLAHLTLQDWADARPFVLALGERTKEATLGRWALSQTGAAFVAIWGELLAENPGFANHVLTRHPNPDLAGLGPEMLLPLLDNSSPAVRTATIMALQDTALSARLSPESRRAVLEGILDTVAPAERHKTRPNRTR